MKAVLWKEIKEQHRDDPNTIALEEMGVAGGHARIDIAVINGELTGYELKSDRDTLARLPRQVEIFSKLFDRLYLVLTSKHIDAAISLIPPWWGIVLVKESELHYLRQSQPNKNIDPMFICTFLWRDEALDILRKYGADKGLRSKPKATLYNRLATTVPLDDLKAEVVSMLKSRHGWREGSIFRGNGDSLISPPTS